MLEWNSGLGRQEPGPHEKKTPEVGSKVRIIGERGNYLVMRLDVRRYLADLMLLGATARMEHGVPFWAIEPVGTEIRFGSVLWK